MISPPPPDVTQRVSCVIWKELEARVDGIPVGSAPGGSDPERMGFLANVFAAVTSLPDPSPSYDGHFRYHCFAAFKDGPRASTLKFPRAMFLAFTPLGPLKPR